MPKLFDVHTHAHFAAYEKDSREVIERALKNDIWLVNVGTQKDTSAEAVKVANNYPEGVYATVGLHPIHTEVSYHDAQELGESDKRQASSIKGFVSRGEEFDYDYYRKLAEDKKVVAIGECGLDYYRADQKLKTKNLKQKEVFLKHIELSHKIKKPLMVHCREAFSDLIGLLNAHRSTLNAIPGIIHFMSGSKDDAKKLLALGFSFSFGGVTTFTRDYDEVIRYIPIERLLLETDAPYVAPAPYRGKRNEPLYIEETAKKIAEIKGVSFEECAQITTENAIRLLRLDLGN